MMTVTPFLMFQDGRAEEATRWYVEVFRDGRVISAERWGAGEPGREGTLKTGLFELAGQRIMCTDSPPVHAFTFTPSISMFVDFDSAAEQERIFAALAEGGKVLMPLDNYGFSQRFAWVQDRYGISWQLNLPAK